MYGEILVKEIDIPVLSSQFFSEIKLLEKNQVDLINIILDSFLRFNDNKEREKVKFLLSQNKSIWNVVCDESNNSVKDINSNTLIVDFENNEKWKVVLYYSNGPRISFHKKGE